MNHLTSAATIVGLAVIGALCASTVSVNLGISWTVGELTQSLDDLVNQIIPHFANVLTMLGMYWLVAKKNVTTGKLVLGTIIVTVALSAFNILA